MLNGLLVPSSGRGTVAGFDIMTQTEAIRQHIGYMSQLFSLYPDLTVEENIAFFSGLYSVLRSRRPARRDWVLEMAVLVNQRRRLTAELSLGWKQRLALGCAVLHEPPILFLDEPTSGVDPISRRSFWDLIYTLASDGTTVFVTTHYMEEADYCHRLALMNRGRLIALDTPQGLRQALTRPLLEVQTSDSARALAVLERVPDVVELALFGRTLHVTVEDTSAALDGIPAALAAHQIEVRSMQPIAPSLEDVFIALVQAAGGAPVDQPGLLDCLCCGSSTRSRTMISARRLLAVARKETIQLRRDTRSLILAFALPLLLLVLFGYAISWDIRNIRTAVLDESSSGPSRSLLDALWASGYFELAGHLTRPAEIGPLFERAAAELVLVIPPDFAADVDAGRPAELQAIVDGSDANTATIVLAYLQAVVQTYSARVRLTEGIGRPPIVSASRVWYNEELLSRNTIVPGLVAVMMMIIAAILTSLTIAREWERGTMEQLAATPVSRVEVVLGKLLPYLAIGLIDVVISSVLGVWLFQVPFRGSPALLMVLSLMFLVGALGLGMFISAVAKSQLLATQMAMIATFLPAFLLSGFMFSIDAMPPALQTVTHLVPARYFLVVTRGIFLKGVGGEVLRTQGLLMIAFAGVGLALAMFRFRKVLA